MRRAVAAGPEAGGRSGLGPMLAAAAVGLALMWASGLVLVWSRWGGPGGLPGLFWLKFVFVLSLTAAAVAIHTTYAAVKRGDTGGGGAAAELGPAAGGSSLLAVLRRSYAFG